MNYPIDFINKIIHGDCLDIMKSIPDNSIDLIVTDPPYGIEYSSNGGPRVSKSRKKQISQETKIRNDAYVNPVWFQQMHRVLKPKSAIYVFCNFDSINAMKQYMINNEFTIKTTLIWDKGNCGMGDLKGDYGNQVELILYGTKGRHILNGGRDRNILKYQRPADAYRLHPTQKPKDLLTFLINKSSYQKSLILDPFIGSGSTAVACINADRYFIGIELDDNYYKVACERVENEFTRLSA